jgi:hypothetical protein
LVSGAVSVLVSVLACLLLQQQVSSDPGVAYPLFLFGTELVGIDLVGGVIPLAIAALSSASVGLIAVMDGRPLPFRSPLLWLSMLAISSLSVVAFALAAGLYGGASIPLSWARGATAVGATIGAGYAATRGRSRTLPEGLSECYAVGTVAMFLGDVVRTFTGLISAKLVVWGGGGALDLML